MAFFSGATRQVTVVIHPDAFLQRRMNNPARGIVDLPQIDAVALKSAGADLYQQKNPSTLAERHLLVTEEVERTTSFERGMPGMEAMIDGRWTADPIQVRNRALEYIGFPEKVNDRALE